MKSPKILFIQTNYPGFLNDFESTQVSGGYTSLKESWDKCFFGQSSFYSMHLNNLGWDSQEIIANSYLLQSAWMESHRQKLTKKELPFTKLLPESVKNLIGSRGWVKQALFKQVELTKPEVLYMHDLSLLTVSDIIHLRRHIKLLVGQIACPLPLDTSPLKRFDLIISSFPHYVTMFRSWGIHSEYLQWCFEPSILKSLKNGPKKYQTVFIGGFSSAHSEGNRMLESVARATQIDFWGYGLNSLSPLSPIRSRYHGQSWGKDMYQTMRDSHIVLNRHINVAGNIANNMRMFDVTGVGSLLITDDKPNMAEFFEVSTECVTYTSVKDLIAKLKYYQKHPKEAQKIAQAGQKRTLKSHTYQARMRTLDEILRHYLS